MSDNPDSPHVHRYRYENGTEKCRGCDREALVCPDCKKCSLCAIGIDPKKVYGVTT